MIQEAKRVSRMVVGMTTATTSASRQPMAIATRTTIETVARDRKSTRLNSSHVKISYAVFCLKKKSNELEKRHPNDRDIVKPFDVHAEKIDDVLPDGDEYVPEIREERHPAEVYNAAQIDGRNC